LWHFRFGQGTHPSVVTFKKRLASTAAPPQPPAPAHHGAPAASDPPPRRARKRDRPFSPESASSEDDEETQQPQTQEPSQSPHRARRVRAPPPRDSPALGGLPGRAAEGMEAVDQLRESRRALRTAVQDPLDEVRRAASSAQQAAGTPPKAAAASAPAGPSPSTLSARRAKPGYLDPSEPGRKCQVRLERRVARTEPLAGLLRCLTQSCVYMRRPSSSRPILPRRFPWWRLEGR
jgi:hypothetical protein